MKAVILAAGYATRLYPLTLNKPKALLSIREKPILEYIIEKISDVEEIDEVFIVTNDKFYMDFVWWLNQNHKKFQKKIEIINDNTVNNETRLGGIGDLWFAITERNIQDDILVIAGDNLFDFRLSDMVEFFLQNKKSAIGVYDIENKEEAKKFGVVELRDDKIAGFEEKPSEPKTSLISTGIYIFTKENIKKIKEYMNTGLSKEGPGLLLQWLSKIQEVLGFVFEGRWFDVGSKETYEKVESDW